MCQWLRRSFGIDQLWSIDLDTEAEGDQQQLRVGEGMEPIEQRVMTATSGGFRPRQQREESIVTIETRKLFVWHEVLGELSILHLPLALLDGIETEAALFSWEGHQGEELGVESSGGVGVSDASCSSRGIGHDDGGGPEDERKERG